MKKIPQADLEEVDLWNPEDWIKYWDEKRQYAERRCYSENSTDMDDFNLTKIDCIIDAFNAKIRLAEAKKQLKKEGLCHKILQGMIAQDTDNWVAGVYEDYDIGPVHIDYAPDMAMYPVLVWDFIDGRFIYAHGVVDKTGIHRGQLTK